jgi:hypothetical protein
MTISSKSCILSLCVISAHNTLLRYDMWWQVFPTNMLLSPSELISIPNTDPLRSFETSVTIYLTIRRNNPDHNLHLHIQRTNAKTKIQTLWDMTPCQLALLTDVAKGHSAIILRITKSRQSTSGEAVTKQRKIWLWGWRYYSRSKRRELAVNRNGVTSQKTPIFINTAVRNWNLANSLMVP